MVFSFANLLTIFFLIVYIDPVRTLSIYCGEESCYDILEVDRQASKTEITKSYRKLASKHHPDRAKSENAKKAAEVQFVKVANAYEILTDNESRREYDYYLDHPDEYYRNYYNYYRRRVAPQVDVRIVIVTTILIISLIQYISSWHKYNDAIKYLLTQQKYRARALELAKEQGLLTADHGKNSVKGKRKEAKEEFKQNEERIIREVLESNMDIKGGYERPRLINLLVCQVVIFPWTLLQYISWHVAWFWKHSIQGKEFSDEEKLYIIRKYLKLSQAQFDSLEEKDTRDFFHQELWVRENFDEWKKKREQSEKEKLAQSGRYKQYRRYMKAGGPGQMTFQED